MCGSVDEGDRKELVTQNDVGNSLNETWVVCPQRV